MFILDELFYLNRNAMKTIEAFIQTIRNTGLVYTDLRH